MELATTAALAALVKKVMDFFKYAANKDVNAVVTQLVAWLVGVGLAFAMKATAFAGGIDLHGTLLENLDTWSTVLLGVNLSSVAGLGWDALKAVDHSNSAIVPNLMGPTPVPQGVEGSSVTTTSNTAQTGTATGPGPSTV